LKRNLKLICNITVKERYKTIFEKIKIVLENQDKFFKYKILEAEFIYIFLFVFCFDPLHIFHIRLSFQAWHVIYVYGECIKIKNSRCNNLSMNIWKVDHVVKKIYKRIIRSKQIAFN